LKKVISSLLSEDQRALNISKESIEINLERINYYFFSLTKLPSSLNSKAKSQEKHRDTSTFHTLTYFTKLNNSHTHTKHTKQFSKKNGWRFPNAEHFCQQQ